MPKDIILTEAEIDLLREACAAKSGRVRVDERDDIQRRVGRAAYASHLTMLGYFEVIDGGWRIKPALKKQVAAILREHG